MYVVTTQDIKKSRINLKISEALRADFKIVSKLRGATVSSLIHQFIVKSIREEKEREPEAFNGITKGRRRVPVKEFADEPKAKQKLEKERA